MGGLSFLNEESLLRSVKGLSEVVIKLYLVVIIDERIRYLTIP